MKHLIILLVLASALWGQGVSQPSASGTTPWTACASGCDATLGASPVTITAGTAKGTTTHGHGAHPIVACFTDTSPRVPIAPGATDCEYTVSTAGAVVLTYTTKPYIVIYGGGTRGATGPAGAAGAPGANGADGVIQYTAGACVTLSGNAWSLDSTCVPKKFSGGGAPGDGTGGTVLYDTSSYGDFALDTSTTPDDLYVCVNNGGCTTAAHWRKVSGGVAAGAVTSSGLTMATSRLLGRTTASTGAIEEITVGTGLSLSGGSLTATGGSGFDPLDLNTIWVRESFSNYTNADGKFGDGLGWEYAAIAGSCTLGQVASGARPGVLSISTSTSTNDACDVRPRGTGNTWTDASQAGWTLRMTWRGATLGASSVFRAGLHDSYTNANVVGVRRDTGSSDSNIFYEVINSSSSTAYDSGVDCGASDYCTVNIRSIEAGKIGFKISKNGGAWSTEYTFCPSGCTVTKTIATTSYIPFFQVKTLTNSARVIYLDEVAFVQTVANHP